MTTERINVQGTDYERWEAYGLDALLQSTEPIFCNQQSSGFGDDEGEWYAAPDQTIMIDGIEYWAMFSGTYGNDHSPMTSHYTACDLYPDRAEYDAEVSRWEGMPEYLESDDDEDLDSDDEQEQDDSEPADGDWVTSDYRTFREHEGRGVISVPTNDAGDSLDWRMSVRIRMDRDQFWPNVWYQGERGDWNLLCQVCGTYASECRCSRAD